MAVEDLYIDVSIKIARGIHSLEKKRGGKRQIAIPQGQIGLVIRDNEIVDPQHFSEVYIGGEVVRLPYFERDANAWVLLLANRIGSIKVDLKREFPGLSINSADHAMSRFMYSIQIVDPIRFVQQFNGRNDIFGANTDLSLLENEIRTIVDTEIKAVFYNLHIDIWTNPDIRRVSTELLGQINNSLDQLGLKLGAAASVYRKYPQNLHQIVLELRAAEMELLRSRDEVDLLNFTDILGLDANEITQFENVSYQLGEGAGFFQKAVEKRGRIRKFISWLENSERNLKTAAQFLRELYGSEPNIDIVETEITETSTPDLEKEKLPHLSTDIALVEKILYSSFKNPMLGVGEWETSVIQMPGVKGTPDVNELIRKIKTGA